MGRRAVLLPAARGLAGFIDRGDAEAETVPVERTDAEEHRFAGGEGGVRADLQGAVCVYGGDGGGR